MSYRLPVPEWNKELRHCCKCGLEDAPIYTGESDDEGHPIFEHRIVIDLVYIDRSSLTKKEKSQGYHYQFMAALNQHVKIRLMCRPCLEHEEDTRKIWEDIQRQKDSLEDESKDRTFMSILCGG